MSHLDSYQILKKLQNIHNSLKQYECLLFIPLFKYLETFTVSLCLPHLLSIKQPMLSLMDRCMAPTLDEKVVVFLGSIPFQLMFNECSTFNAFSHEHHYWFFSFSSGFFHNVMLDANLIFHEMITNVQECAYTW